MKSVVSGLTRKADYSGGYTLRKRDVCSLGGVICYFLGCSLDAPKGNCGIR